MNPLEIRNATIARSNQTLIADLNLRVEPGEVLTLMGVSGSGKSTLLNWIIGALDPAFEARGELWIGGERRDGLPIEARRIGILFQDDLLFPHLSVGKNLAFALPAKLEGRGARRRLIEDTLADVGLAGFFERDPATLSGGQRARVSVLRALLAEPDVLLLDEPFAKLDAVLREQFRSFVFERIARLAIPALLVTHDPDDVPAGGRDIEKGAAIGRPDLARQRAIDAVGQAIHQDRKNRPGELLQHDQRHGGEARDKAEPRHLIGANAARGQPRRQRAQKTARQFEHAPIKHRAPRRSSVR